MNLSPSHCRNPKSVSRTKPRMSRQEREASPKPKRTRPGARWVQTLRDLNQKWKKSERIYHSLLARPPVNLEALENLPNPLPVSEPLQTYWQREQRKEKKRDRSEIWEKVKKRICPQLTPLEKVIFLKIIRTPKIQDWEIAAILNLQLGTVRWYRGKIERKLKREFGGREL